MLKDLLLKRYDDILYNIENIKSKYNISHCVDIVAVTKYSTLEIIKDFLSLKLNVPLAESKAQSLRDRASSIENVNWHFIGRIQKNKIKYIVNYSSLIQSVDNLDTALEINIESKKKSKVQDILLQLNISKESQKCGFDILYFKKNYENIVALENIRVKGLMGVATHTDNTLIIEKEFESLYKIYNSINNEYIGKPLSILSMGMSSDYTLAVKHNANMLRIGSTLFSDL